MLKKFLAAATAIVLGLGIVTLVAAPAQAHTPKVTATFQCETPTTGTITWTVGNDDQFGPSEVTGVSGSAASHLQPATLMGHQFTASAPGDTATYTQAVSGPGKQDLTVELTWGPNQVYSHTGSITPDFSKCNTVDPAGPRPTDAICTGPGTVGQGMVTFDAFDKVTYQWSTDSGVHKTYHTVTTNPTWFNVGTVYIKVLSVKPPYQLKSDINSYKWTVPINGPNPSTCTTAVTPQQPQPNQPVCTAAGTVSEGSFVVPTTTGVDYFVKIDNGNYPNTPAAPGSTVTVPQGHTYTLQARAQQFYTLTDHDQGTSSRKTFATVTINTQVASKCIVPVQPSFTDSHCTTPGQSSQASYTVTAVNGVIYKVNGGVVSGTVNVTSFPTTVLVTAFPDTVNGYSFVGGVASIDLTPAHQFTSPGDCVLPTDPSVTITPSLCYGGTTPGSRDATYTIGNSDKVTYVVTINGRVSSNNTNGTYVVSKTAHIVIDATPKTGYKFTDGVKAHWDERLQSPGLCLVVTTAGTDFAQLVCDTEDYTVGTVANFTIDPSSPVGTVKYSYIITNGFQVVDSNGNATAGTYDLQPGDRVIITAVPKAGYYFSGNSPLLKVWSYESSDASSCFGIAQPVKPDVTPQTCTVNDHNLGVYTPGTIIIPTTTGVKYFIDGTQSGAGTYPAANGPHTITAMAQANYVLDKSYPKDGYVVTILAAKACGQLPDHPIVAPLVASSNTTCDTVGSFTLSNTLDDVDPSFSDAVLWTVDGSSVAEGTYQVAGNRTVHVHAAPNAPDFGFADAEQTDWTLTFSAPAACADLKTLALTGTSSPAGWIGLGSLLLISGLALLTVYTVRRRSEQAEQE
ncbi:MAG TPA: hypothetical protein VN759_02270 [Pseudolysinimonas sp.]|nr:hypothetical protein [Pseudolysinimonas sp.]